jgi:four helix bundle protein
LHSIRATDRWRRSQRFGLTIQVRRAALSVPSNIAKGAAKRGSREFRRFLDIALGSMADLWYLLRFSRDYGLLEPHRDRAGRLT